MSNFIKESKNIILQNVSKRFHKKTLYENVNLNIEQGNIYLLVGANGSGKSTLLNMMLNLLKPTNGKIFFNDAIIGGYTNIVPFFDYLTIKENVEYFKKNTDDDLLKSNFEAFSVYDYINKEVGKCSQGMQQKALISFCLAKKDDVIILDEPTSALDFNNRTIFFNLIKKLKEKNKTIIISTNTVSDEFVNFSDFVIGIQNQTVHIFKRDSIEYFYVVTFTTDEEKEKFLNEHEDTNITNKGDFVFIEEKYFDLFPKAMLFKKYQINSFRKEYKLGDFNER